MSLNSDNNFKLSNCLLEDMGYRQQYILTQAMGDETSDGKSDGQPGCDPQDTTDLAALPDAVRAILGEGRMQSKGVAAKPVVAGDGQELPYPCKLYEAVPGEEELLQLQWMRIDVRSSPNAVLIHEFYNCTTAMMLLMSCHVASGRLNALLSVEGNFNNVQHIIHNSTLNIVQQ